ncbi:unnamed protein product [Absidia cylindrospora]
MSDVTSQYLFFGRRKKNTNISLLDLLSIGTKKPFHIVLVDIKEAAKNRVIHCVEKPLLDEDNGEDLKYVTLSYRWGEWQETMIDTNVGYTASVTSFDLEDFYYLCDTMAGDPDFRSIQYVWVDAICVDQINHERRKATIYQMPNIYEHAAFILAVPDLHSAYLRNTMLKYEDLMVCSRRYTEYLYHLIHGNTENLVAIDENFLTNCGIPKDTEIRELLTKKTDHFAEAFMNYDLHDQRIQRDKALDLVCAAIDEPISPSTNDLNLDDSSPSSNGRTQVKYRTDNGLRLTAKTIDDSERKMLWKELISERSSGVRQSMEFLADLIKDWSTRVWVISEFSIARKKNNLKFWFIQLKTNDYKIPWIPPKLAPPFRMSFFNYDFDRPVIGNTNQLTIKSMNRFRWFKDSHTVYLRFHFILIHQLNRRTFLDMILKSKASKNEDRFYAVLPQSEYKTQLLICNKWNINTICSVKLKLYEIMNTNDKLNLLFWSGTKKSSNVGLILPSFATSTLSLDASTDYLQAQSCNFDLGNPSTIMLHQTTTTDGKKKNKGSFHYYMNVKPLAYYTLGSKGYDYIGSDNTQYYAADKILDHKISLYTSIQIIDLDVVMGREMQVTVVAIPSFDATSCPQNVNSTPNGCIFLIGNPDKNIWVLDHRRYVLDLVNPGVWDHHHIDDYSDGFNIY